MNKLFICVMSLMVSFHVYGMESQNDQVICPWDEVEKPRIKEQSQYQPLRLPQEVFFPDEIRVVKAIVNVRCIKHAQAQDAFNRTSRFYDEKGKLVYCGPGYEFDPEHDHDNTQAFALGLYKLTPKLTIESGSACTIQ
jgi:hypothetical protein